MKYIGVTFPNSSKIYTYKTKINLKRGATYDIIADNVTRYSSPVTVMEIDIPKPTDFVVREITRAVKAANTERYEALMYKIESGVCHDDFGLLNKEIIDDIQAWNEDLARNKMLEKDKWIGAFYPNIYSDFNFIEYEKLYTGEME